MIGIRHGSLTVLKFQTVFESNGTKYVGRNYLLVQCDCGTKVLNRKQDFGKTKMCLKCSTKKYSSNISRFKYQKKTEEERLARFLKKAPGEVGAERAFRHYQGAAKKRNKEWNLTFEEFKTIVSQDCHYCGMPPKMIQFLYSNLKSINEHNKFVRNGIDRVDNSVGYIRENVVACCKECNFAKKDMSVESFIAMAKRIAAKAS